MKRIPFIFYFNAGSSAEVTVPADRWEDATDYIAAWELSSNISKEEMFEEFVQRFVWPDTPFLSLKYA